MRQEIKRQTYAWLLLSVFVPMMVVASLHVHEGFEVQTECSACVHHQAHAGHLSNGFSHLHDCVLCQLLSTHVVLVAMSLLPLFAVCCRGAVPCWQETLRRTVGDAHGSRAPPVVK